MTHSWQNWGLLQKCNPSKFIKPKTEEEIIAIINSAKANGEKVKVVGAGHSFTPIALTDGVMISLDAYADILSIEGSIVTVQAGIRLKDLNEQLSEKGLALENTGGVLEQTVSGAISTATHGTGQNLGSMSTQIVGIRVIDSSGNVHYTSEESNRDIFKAAQVGLGVIGVISTVAIRCVPAFALERVIIPVPLDNLQEKVEELSGEERLQFFWFPPSQEAVVMLFRNTDKPVTGLWGKDMFIDHDSSGVDISWKALSDCLIDENLRWCEMEYFLPAENAIPCLKEWMECIKKLEPDTDKAASLFTGMRYVKGDDAFLSPEYGRDTAVLSFLCEGNKDQPTNPVEFERYGRLCEKICRSYGGRPHWGKEHFMVAADLKPLYPKWDDFLKVRMKMDPSGLFLNKYMKVLLGIES